MDGLMDRISLVLRDYLAWAFGALLTVVGLAVGFYIVSSTAIIDRVSATEVEVSRNQELGDEIHGKLDTIYNSVQAIALDMRTVKANQESIKEDIDRLGK